MDTDWKFGHVSFQDVRSAESYGKLVRVRVVTVGRKAVKVGDGSSVVRSETVALSFNAIVLLVLRWMALRDSS